MIKLFYAFTLVFYKKFKAVSEDRVDFYGPFWIYATMVFSLSVSQNLYSFLIKPEGSSFQYSISYLPNAFTVIFIFGFLIPLFYNVILRAFGGFVSFCKMITIYGYSQSIQIVMLLLCAYPDSTF